MKYRPTTLKDMAQRLKTSVATISRALKDKPDISAEMRQKVKELAAELNYQPNPIALSLKHHRSRTIGVVIPKVVHYLFSTMISGILEEAEQQGYNVLITETNQQYGREVRMVQDLMHGKVDGLLICFANETRSFDHIAQLNEAALPFVLFDKATDLIEANKVMVDDYDGAFAATTHLIEQGYQQIAHINGAHALHHSQARMQGYLDALARHGRQPAAGHIVKAEQFSIEEGRAIGAYFWGLQRPPDAVFGIADEVVIGVHDYLKGQGVKIPEAFGLVGFSDSLLASMVDPSLSSVYQPGKELGRISLLRLLELIRADEIDLPRMITTHVLKTSLIIRKSSSRLCMS